MTTVLNTLWEKVVTVLVFIRILLGTSRGSSGFLFTLLYPCVAGTLMIEVKENGAFSTRNKSIIASSAETGQVCGLGSVGHCCPVEHPVVMECSGSALSHTVVTNYR